MFALARQITTYEDDSKEYALGAILLNKLPRHIRSPIHDQSGSHENLVPTDLLQILNKIVRKEAILHKMKDCNNCPPEAYINADYQHQMASKSSPRKDHTQPAARNTQLSTKGCAFCGDTHIPSSCPTHQTSKYHIKVIKAKSVCYNCLPSRHTTKDCQSKRTCPRCSKRHQSSMCFSPHRPKPPHQGIKTYTPPPRSSKVSTR